MIHGVVNANLEPIISITLQDDQGQWDMMEAVIDSGFNGVLTLPLATILHLGLGFVRQISAVLGDGTSTLLDIYEATIDWDGRLFRIEVGEADPTPLVGMSLMRDYHLEMDVRPGGPVTLTAIP